MAQERLIEVATGLIQKNGLDATFYFFTSDTYDPATDTTTTTGETVVKRVSPPTALKQEPNTSLDLIGSLYVYLSGEFYDQRILPTIKVEVLGVTYNIIKVEKHYKNTNLILCKIFIKE